MDSKPIKPPWWILLLQILPLVFQMVNEVVIQVTELDGTSYPVLPEKDNTIPDPIDER